MNILNNQFDVEEVLSLRHKAEVGGNPTERHRPTTNCWTNDIHPIY